MPGSPKKIGFVETPPEIAELMVSLSTSKKDGLVLDTGCGRGVFLEALVAAGYQNCIGIEIDPELYNFCRRKFENRKEVKVVLGDFLTYDFSGEKFDLIIGNPPYAHFNQLPQSIGEKVKDIIKTSEGDIYYAFIIRSIDLLNYGGELIYITPYHFFYNTHAKYVREYLLKSGVFEIIIDLDEVDLFKDEHPETLIFKFRKFKSPLQEHTIKLLNVISRKASPSEIKVMALRALDTHKSNELFEYKEIPHFMSSGPWSTFYENIPQFPHVLLKDLAKVGVGLVSGFDKAFLLEEEEYFMLSSGEKKLVKDFVKAENCKRFVVEGSSKYILIDDTISTEEELRVKYPNIYGKLARYKTQMKNRYLPKGKQWFHWQALRNYKFLLKHLEKERIYVPALDRRPYNRFSLGKMGLLPSGDVLFIQPYNHDDLIFLLGYLNSSFFRKYYLSRGGRRGGRIAFTQKLLENAEIPLFSEKVKNEIRQIVKEILYLLESKKEHDISFLERELDRQIYEAIYERKFETLLEARLDNFLGSDY